MGCVSLRGRARAGTLILVAILSIFVGKAAFVPEMSKSCSSWKSQRGAHWTRSNKPVLVAVNQSPRNSKLHRMASIASTSSDSQQAGMSVPDAAAIIAGTALGGGFLALPSVTAPMGVMPAIFGLIVVWAFLAAVGLVYAEASVYTLAEKAKIMEDAEKPAEEDRALMQDEGVSVVSVAQRALGGTAAVICSLAFASQMLAVVTAQVAKSGELVSTLTGLPYIADCIVPSVLVGLFAFETPPRIVEQSNTVLAATMIGGFLFLIVSTVGANLSQLPAALSALPPSDWGLLIPAASSTWALPIFFNLLCFGQSIPLVVERMGPNNTGKVRNAILLGSSVPLLMGMAWVVVAALLGSSLSLDGDQDPVIALVQGPPKVAIPVLLLACGAIGTTLIASYLALGQFAADAMCAATGCCSIEDNERAKMASVILPALVACVGPQLYLPLLSFTGAFPTMLLYGLLPPLALLAAQRAKERMVPGGRLMLIFLAALSVKFLLTNLFLWLRPS